MNTWNSDKDARYASYKDALSTYVERVLSGEEGAGELETLAVQRYVRDRDNKEADFYFDENAALRVIDFAPTLCRLTVGQFTGRRFHLAPWQMFCIWNIFGFKDKETHYRRFNNALISIARKNGKSTLCGYIAVYILLADGENSAEIYTASPTLKQSGIVFRAARQIIEATESLRTKVKINQYELKYRATDSFIRMISSEKRISGLNPHLVLLDEVHEFTKNHRDTYEKLTTGCMARTQPLILRVTTEGDEHSTIYYEEKEKGLRILHGASSSLDHYFFFLCCPPEDIDPSDETKWRIGNPNLGVSVEKKQLRQILAEARDDEEASAKFRRYNLNLFSTCVHKFIRPDIWMRGAQPTTIEEGMTCWVGVDFARNDDLAAIAACFPIIDSDGITKYHLLAKTFTCENRPKALDEHIGRWVKAGFIEQHPGDCITYSRITDTLLDWNSRYKIVNVAFDPHFALAEAQRWEEDHGLNIFKFNQGGTYTMPISYFLKYLKENRIRHGNDPLLTWCFGNLQIKNFPDGRMAPVKGHPVLKIDTAVSSLMAFAGAAFQKGQEEENGELALYFLE